MAQKILDLKGKVIVDTDLHKLPDEISKFAEAIDQVSLENRKLAITQNVNSRFEEKIINLEKNQVEGRQYSYQEFRTTSLMKIWRIR